MRAVADEPYPGSEVNLTGDPVSPLRDKDDALPGRLLQVIDCRLDRRGIVRLAIRGRAKASALQVNSARSSGPAGNTGLGPQSGRGGRRKKHDCKFRTCVRVLCLYVDFS